MYPLVPNDNPGMKTNFNAYIFPNNDADMNLNIEAKEAECSFVGITFDTRTIPKEQVAIFEDILTNFNSLVYQDTNKSTDVKLPIVNRNLVAEKPVIIDGADKEKTKPPIGVGQIQLNDESQKGMTETWSADNIASSLITGAEYISRGVGTSTEYAAKYMGLGSEKLKSNLNPNAAPAKVDPSLRKVAENVRYGTHLTVRCSSYLVNKLGSLASYTAKAVAPHIREGTSHLLTKTGMTANKAEATNTLDNICKVGGSSLKGVVMVYDSLEKAAFTLGKNFTEQTVTVVDYK